MKIRVTDLTSLAPLSTGLGSAPSIAAAICWSSQASPLRGSRDLKEIPEEGLSTSVRQGKEEEKNQNDTKMVATIRCKICSKDYKFDMWHLSDLKEQKCRSGRVPVDMYRSTSRG